MYIHIGIDKTNKQNMHISLRKGLSKISPDYEEVKDFESWNCSFHRGFWARTGPGLE